MQNFGIHWFRRDLRVAGNAALRWNWKQNRGNTLGVFFFDSKFLARPDFSHSRFAFFLQTLKSLQTELREVGGDLLVLDQGPDSGFESLLSILSSNGVGKLPTCVTFNRDYEPFARVRDARIEMNLERMGIQVHTERDHLLIEPDELKRDDSSRPFYQIYTPFSKRWYSMLSQDDFRSRVSSQKEAIAYLEKRKRGERIEPFLNLTWKKVLPQKLGSKKLSGNDPGSFQGDVPHALQDSLDSFIHQNSSFLKIKLPPAGSLSAYEALLSFCPKVSEYLDQRDFPAVPGTSKLSIYLKNGSLSSALVMHVLGLTQLNWTEKKGKNQYLKELIWREFYYHILYHQPRVEHEAFHTQYKEIRWENRESWFEAWKEGKTGYPIVDAGMRELKTTGWMHNRVRMIVASFLTKDLLIDWRWGENHFMKDLLDGDLAPNNGGWQWAASTGCDPQPYFRIFNPVLQSQKFDPSGEYIKKFVPELRNVSVDQIHAPWENPLLNRYISPIVDHATQKQRAIALYKKS